MARLRVAVGGRPCVALTACTSASSMAYGASGPNRALAIVRAGLLQDCRHMRPDAPRAHCQIDRAERGPFFWILAGGLIDSFRPTSGMANPARICELALAHAARVPGAAAGDNDVLGADPAAFCLR